jgi:hypothetical protein
MGQFECAMLPESRFYGQVKEQLVNRSRFLVTYRDCDVAFVWTLEHLFKTNWQRSSSVQIKPPQPKFLVFHSVLILSMLLVVK